MPIAGVVSEFQAWMDDVNDSLYKKRSTKFAIVLGNFNTHIGTDDETWKGVIGKHGDSAFIAAL